jgi:hypothetical protein
MNILSDVGNDNEALNSHKERVNRQDNLKKSRDSLFAFLDEMEIRESAQLEDLESSDDEDNYKANEDVDTHKVNYNDVDLNSSAVKIVSPNTFRHNTKTNNETGESSTGGTMSNKKITSRDKAIAKLEKIGEVSSKAKAKQKTASFFACCAGDRE